MLYVVGGKVTHEAPLNEEEIEKIIKPLEELNEDKNYKGYTIHWTTDKNGGKHVVVLKNKEELDSFDNEDEAIKAINKGELDEEVNEEFNPFKDLKRLPDNTKMTRGLFTDGEGGVYKAPTSGKSSKLKFKGHTFEYDFGTHKILMDGNPDEHGLSISSWLDNPEYWCSVVMDNMSEEEVLDEGFEDAYDFLEKSGETLAKEFNKKSSVSSAEYDEDNWGVYVYLKNDGLVLVKVPNTRDASSIIVEFYEKYSDRKAKSSKSVKLSLNDVKKQVELFVK